MGDYPRAWSAALELGLRSGIQEVYRRRSGRTVGPSKRTAWSCSGLSGGGAFRWPRRASPKNALREYENRAMDRGSRSITRSLFRIKLLAGCRAAEQRGFRLGRI